jgi:hypothetical protein
MSYEVYHMNEIHDKITTLSKIDAFIFFDTQGERTMRALSELHNRDSLDDVMVLSFNTAISATTDKYFQSSNIDITFAKVDQNLSSNIIPCLQEINKNKKKKNSIGVDITCMPIPLFIQILNFMYKNHNDKQLIIYYTEPLRYTLDNLFDYSAYSGEIDIKAVPGFAGETSQINEVKRVVFYLMGFEMAYLNKLILQDVNPNEIAPINGFPSYFPKYKDISLINNDTNFYEKDVEIIFSEANNPFETYNTLVMLKDKYKGFKIDIIPVGTKPMALGACLFALKSDNASCRIIFPFPAGYIFNQNSGSGRLWEYRLKNRSNG